MRCFPKVKIFYFCNQRIFARQEKLLQIAYGISERDNISNRERRSSIISLFMTIMLIVLHFSHFLHLPLNSISLSYFRVVLIHTVVKLHVE